MRCLALALLVLLTLAAACGTEKKERAQAVQHLVEARTQYIKGDYAEAEKKYEQYLRLAPDGEFSWEAWNRRVYIWLTVHRNSAQAAELLKEMAVEFSDEPARLPQILLQLANAYETAGELANALEAWKAYLELEELDAMNATSAYHHMARLEQDRREYDQAMHALDRCMALAATTNQTQPGPQAEALRDRQLECRYEQARTRLLQQRYEDAQILLDALLKEPGFDPELNATAGYVLAEIYRNQNNPDKAVALLKAIQEMYPNPGVVKSRLEKIEQSKK